MIMSLLSYTTCKTNWLSWRLCRLVVIHHIITNNPLKWTQACSKVVPYLCSTSYSVGLNQTSMAAFTQAAQLWYFPTNWYFDPSGQFSANNWAKDQNRAACVNAAYGRIIIAYLSRPQNSLEEVRGEGTQGVCNWGSPMELFPTQLLSLLRLTLLPHHLQKLWKRT